MGSIVIIFICLLLNAFFAATETAFVSISKAHLKELARKGHEEAKKSLFLRDNPERTLSVLQLGITFVGAVAAAVAGAAAEDWFKPFFFTYLHFSETFSEFFSILFVVVPYTYLNVIIGEILPKTIALRNPKKVLFFNRFWLSIVDKLLSPVVSFLERSTKVSMNIFFRRYAKNFEGVIESLDLTDLRKDHRQYLINLRYLQENIIKNIMLPWKEVILIDAKMTLDEIEMTLIKSGHTRLAVADKGQIIGMLNTKEFIALRHFNKTNWQTLLRPALFVEEEGSLIEAFKLMQDKHCHLAIVCLATKPIGIVTIEDIIEEVFGEIYDEDDDGKVQEMIKTILKKP